MSSSGGSAGPPRPELLPQSKRRQPRKPHPANQRVEIAGIVAEPDSAWVTQCGRHVTDAGDGFLLGKRFLLHDRAERFVRTIKESCLNRMILFGERS